MRLVECGNSVDNTISLESAKIPFYRSTQYRKSGQEVFDLLPVFRGNPLWQLPCFSRFLILFYEWLPNDLCLCTLKKVSHKNVLQKKFLFMQKPRISPRLFTSSFRANCPVMARYPRTSPRASRSPNREYAHRRQCR